VSGLHRPAGLGARLSWALVAAAVALGGCARDPGESLPDGTLLAGETAALLPLLRGLEHFTGSPAALAARRLEAKLAGCKSFLAHCPPGDACSLGAVATCEVAGEVASAAAAVRGDAGWLFSHRSAERRFTSWGSVEPGGGLTIRALLAEDGGEPQPWQALLPADEAPAAPLLSSRGALLQLRLRADRGDEALAALAPPEAAQEHLGLAGNALAGLALEGTTEVALFEPAAGESIPPLALALHTRLRDAAARGMESVLTGVRSRWPVSREGWTRDDSTGACLSNLNVLPGLAPCYLSTERALVLGWNRRAVELALAAAPTGPAPERSELTLDLARLPVADAIVHASFERKRVWVGRPYPWSRLHVAGQATRDGYELTLQLSARKRESDG
jgi:hypothetical protein